MRPRYPAKEKDADKVLEESLGKMQVALQDMEVDDDGQSEMKPLAPAKSEEEVLKDSTMAKTRAIFDSTILQCDSAYPAPTEASAACMAMYTDVSSLKSIPPSSPC